MYRYRTNPGGWCQPAQPATEAIQENIDILRADFEKTSQLFNLNKFEARRYWYQDSFQGLQNFCVETDIGETESNLVYIEFRQNHSGKIAFTAFLRSWPWMM
ncbi:uncharacterized protein LOC117113973 [Anneissia japonica]|uniref:uncharacterized protein LOC117113973 n=1 Tax=Anneissia japonica TaxID=1529436 RepID=UPI0014257A70|nr:uncharacterized protein LOC117113973 [Anneissia japonica]